jgi:hypothetical protein
MESKQVFALRGDSPRRDSDGRIAASGDLKSASSGQSLIVDQLWRSTTSPFGRRIYETLQKRAFRALQK